MKYRNSFLSSAFPWMALLGFLLAIYLINSTPMHETPLDQLSTRGEQTHDAAPVYSEVAAQD